jgi:hypothetical protein
MLNYTSFVVGALKRDIIDLTWSPKGIITKIGDAFPCLAYGWLADLLVYFEGFYFFRCSLHWVIR